MMRKNSTGRITAKASWALAVLCLVLSFSRVQAQSCRSNMLTLPQGATTLSYLVARDAPSLHLSGAFTLECWARANGDVTYAGLIEKADPGSQPMQFYGIVFDEEELPEGVFNPSDNPKTVNALQKTTVQQWHHYAFSFTPLDSLRLYIDGIEVANKATLSPSSGYGIDSLRIGLSIFNNLYASFDGAIDEVRIWREARTQAQIVQSMHAPVANSPMLAAYYPFDDEIGSTTIHDFSGNNNTGYLRGGARIDSSTSPVLGSAGGFMLDAKQRILDFGTLTCTPTADGFIEIRNIGRSTINGSLGLASGNDFSIASGNDFDLPADTNQWRKIRVHFAPRFGGAVLLDTLIASSSNICGGVIRIPIQGRAIRVAAKFTPDTLAFGSYRNCELPLTRSVTVENTGDTIISFSNPTFNTQIGATILNQNFILKPGESRTVQVRLNAFTDGAFSSKVSFTLDKCSQAASFVITGERKTTHIDVPDIVEYGSITTKVGGVAKDTLIYVTNTGSELINIISVVFPNSKEFTLAKPFDATALNPGESVPIYIHFESLTCGDFNGTMRLLGSPCKIDTLVPLHISLQGPNIVQSASLIQVGRACWQRDTIIVITNASGEKITLTGGHNTEPGALIVGAGHFPVSLDPGQKDTIKVSFTPTRAGDYDIHGVIDVEPCGTLKYEVIGAAGVSNIGFVDTLLNFGHGCDVTPKSRSFSISNESTSAISIGSIVPRGSTAFKLGTIQLPFTLGVGEQRDIPIIYTPTLGERADTRFTLLTEEQCFINEAHAYGSRSKTAFTYAPVALQFDTVCPGSVKHLSVKVDNHGIDTLDITDLKLSGSADFALDQSSTKIPPDSTGVFQIGFTPTSTGGKSAKLTISPSDCGDEIVVDIGGSGGAQAELRLSEASHDFGRVRVGDSSSFVIKLTNPSCQPLVVDRSTIPLSGAYYFVDSSVALLPKTILQGDTLSLRLMYAPIRRGYDSLSLTINSGTGTSSTFTLTGEAISPLLTVSDSILDFGYLMKGTSKMKSFVLTNVGDDTAIVTRIGTLFGDYSTALVAPFKLAPHAWRPIQIVFNPSFEGMQSSAMEIDWDGPAILVGTRGYGATKGILPSVVQLDFGKVHIRDSALRFFTISAATPGPIRVTGFGYLVQIDSQEFPAFATTPAPLDTPLTVEVRFKPQDRAPLERPFTIYYETTQLDSVLLTVTGEGVEEIASVTPDSIDFSTVAIDQSLTKDIHIKNTGTFPLKVDSLSISNSIFSLDSKSASTILPNQERKVRVTYSPKRAKPSEGIATVYTSARTYGVQKVYLSGVGSYSVLTQPEFVYEIGGATVRVGDHPLLPVTLSGQNLDKVDLDSFRVVLRFDPGMVYPESVSSDISASEGMALSMERIGDSLVAISGSRGNVNTSYDQLFRLQVEALLGPHDTSVVSVESAYPAQAGSKPLSTSLFVVTDCGNQPGGLSFRGNYVLSAGRPNPARDVVTFDYTLGAGGHVDLTLFDPMGRPVMQPVDQYLTAGEHKTTVKVSSLPAGRYEYVMKSADQVLRGVLIVTH